MPLPVTVEAGRHRRLARHAAAVVALALTIVLAADVSVVQGPSRLVASRNLIINPSFESSTAGWGSWHGRLKRVSLNNAPDGKYVVRVSRSSGTAYSTDDWPGTSPITRGSTYTASAYAAASSASAVGKPTLLTIREHTATGAYVNQLSSSAMLTSSFQQLRVQLTAQSAADLVDVYLVQINAGAGDSFYADEFALTEGSSSPTATPTPTSAPPTTATAATPTPTPTATAPRPIPTSAPTPTHPATPRPRLTPTPNTAGNTQALLTDFDGTSYNWALVAPHYRAIALNSWNYPWISAIRAANPSVKVFEYKDLTSSRPSACQQSQDGALNNQLPAGIDYCWAKANHPDWFLKNSSGTDLQEKNFPDNHEMAYGLKAYQDQWASNVAADLVAENWDGVVMDNALTNNAYGVSPTYPTDASVQAAMQSMLAEVGPQIKAAHRLEIANVGFDTEYPGIWAAWLPYLTGLTDQYTWSWSTSVDQSVPDWNIFENEVKSCADAHDLCWFNVGATQLLPQSLVTFAVASYLLYADGNSLLGPGDMLWSNYPALYTNLGAALGAAHINANGNWQRDFQGGSVIVNLSTWTGTVT